MKKVLQFFRPYLAAKTQTIIFIFYSSCRALYNVFFVLVVWYITTTIENGDKDWLLFRLIIILVLIIAHFLLKILVKTRLIAFEMKIREYLDAEYLKKFLTMSNNYAESLGTWRLISLIQKWINTRVALAEEVLWWKMIMLITVLFSLWYVAIYYPFIFLRTIAFVVFAIFWITPFANKALHWRKKRKDGGTSMDRTLVRRLMSKFEILQNNTYIEELNARKWMYASITKFFYKEKMQQAFGYDGVVVVSELIYIVWVMYVVGMWAIEGVYTVADFVVISWLWVTIHVNIFNLQMEARRTIDQLIHIEKLWSLFESSPKLEWYDEWSIFKYKTWTIELKHLTYGYDKLNPIFNDFSLSLEWWKKTALVWMSWSWKSTLVKLIAGYLNPDNGTVIVDGQKLSDVSLKSYYSHIGYLTQEPSVFDGTILDNLLYASPTSDDKAIADAIQSSQCDFIYELPEGIHTEIWERWIRLSGWQRQRLAIAKIFLKDPAIIILDEPTSALDSFSEEAITQAMHLLFEWRTVIIIAHRLQTVKEADSIILLAWWKVSERGTHEELVKVWWEYAKMLEVQTWF